MRGLYIMDKNIVLAFNLFTLEHSIFITGSDSVEKVGQYKLEDIPEVITSLAKEKEIYSIKLGGMTSFAEKLIEDIKEKEEPIMEEDAIDLGDFFK